MNNLSNAVYHIENYLEKGDEYAQTKASIEVNFADILGKMIDDGVMDWEEIKKSMELVDKEMEEAIQEETWEREDYENNK